MITIDKEYSVQNLDGGLPKRFKVHKLAPNPSYKFSPEKFQRFVHSISQATSGDGIRRAKVSAVFRLMRMVQDSENIEARFTYYWTALESITRDAFPNDAGIDQQVATAAVPCGLHRKGDKCLP